MFDETCPSFILRAKRGAALSLARGYLNFVLRKIGYCVNIDIIGDFFKIFLVKNVLILF